MAAYDIMCFLEYYTDRTNVVDPVSGKRVPDGQWQNFYQSPQELGIDPDVDGEFAYLPFDASGFASVFANSTNDLSINLAATGEVVDLSEAAVDNDTLIIASLVVQDPGQPALDPSSAVVVSRYVGSIETVGLDDTTASWSVSSAIDKIKAQVPSRKISSDLLGKFFVA